MDELEARCGELEEENSLLRKRIAFLDRRLDELHETNADLMRSVATMLERVEDRCRLLTELIENSNEIAILKDTFLRYLGVNRAYLELTGRADDDGLLGCTDAELFQGTATQAEIEQYMENDRRALALPRGQSIIAEEALHGEGGAVRTFLTRKFPVYDKNGTRLLGVGTLTSEITDRKRAEEALQTSERFLRTVLQTTADGFWVIDTTTRRIVDANEAYCAMSGFSREELLALRIEDLEAAATSAEIRERAERIMRNGSEIFESRHRRKNGGVFDVEVSVAFVDIDGGRFVCFCRDITERKKAEERVRLVSENEQRLRIEAEAAARAKSQFLANTSHELRTPLNGIMGFADLLSETPLDETQRTYLDNVRRSARSLLDMVNEVLDFSGIASGKLRLEPVEADPARLASEAAEAVRRDAEEKGLSLLLSIQNGLPRRIIADTARLRQVLINLLDNAVKFTPDGFVELSVEYSLGESEGFFTFSVRDTGIGVRDPNLRTLFQPFYQEDASNTRKYGGTGLGLAVSDGILRMMGSELEVESVEGEGSRFFFSIPAGRGEEAPTSPEKMEPSGETSPPKVLIVEDVKLNRSLIRALIRKELPAAVVCEAEDGLQGVEQFREHAPDIVFMDLQMPVKDGFEATHEIRALEEASSPEPGGGRRTPVIAITANATLEAQTAAFECGMDEYIIKPLDRHTLRRILERFLGR